MDFSEEIRPVGWMLVDPIWGDGTRRSQMARTDWPCVRLAADPIEVLRHGGGRLVKAKHTIVAAHWASSYAFDETVTPLVEVQDAELIAWRLARAEASSLLHWWTAAADECPVPDEVHSWLTEGALRADAWPVALAAADWFDREAMTARIEAEGARARRAKYGRPESLEAAEYFEARRDKMKAASHAARAVADSAHEEAFVACRAVLWEVRNLAGDAARLAAEERMNLAFEQAAA